MYKFCQGEKKGRKRGREGGGGEVRERRSRKTTRPPSFCREKREEKGEEERVKSVISKPIYVKEGRKGKKRGGGKEGEGSAESPVIK